jgi:hypothetical protein
MQLVATTHSPFIIQSLQAGELVVLDGPGEEEMPREDLRKMGLEDITQEKMGVAQPWRSKHYQDMYEAAREYYQVLQQAQGADAEGSSCSQRSRRSRPRDLLATPQLRILPTRHREQK